MRQQRARQRRELELVRQPDEARVAGGDVVEHRAFQRRFGAGIERVGVELAEVVQQRSGDDDVEVGLVRGALVALGDGLRGTRHAERVFKQAVQVGVMVRHGGGENLEGLPRFAVGTKDEAQEFARFAAASVDELPEFGLQPVDGDPGGADERGRTVLFALLIDEPDLVELVLRLALEFGDRADQPRRFALEVLHQRRRGRIADFLFDAVLEVEPLGVAPDLGVENPRFVHDGHDPVGFVVFVALFLELRDQADGLEFGIDGKRAHLRERFVRHEKTPLRDESGSAEKDPAANNL